MGSDLRACVLVQLHASRPRCILRCQTKCSPRSMQSEQGRGRTATSDMRNGLLSQCTPVRLHVSNRLEAPRTDLIPATSNTVPSDVRALHLGPSGLCVRSLMTCEVGLNAMSTAVMGVQFTRVSSKCAHGRMHAVHRRAYAAAYG